MEDYLNLRDEDLLKSIERGDFEAFNELYRRYAQKLVSYINSKLNDIEESKDIVQEIFVAIWIDRKNILVINSFSSYLFRIAQNKSLNFFKKNKIKEVYVKSFATFLTEISPEESHQRFEEEREAALNKVLGTLPEKMCTIFKLRYFENLTNEQVATRLGLSPHTVATQMKRALKTIRGRLDILTFLLVIINL